MAFPSTRVLDNFNRSENPLSTGWDAAILNSLQANGTTCQSNSASYSIQTYGTSFVGNQECFVTVTTKGASGHELFLTVMGKDVGSTATIDGYDIHITIAAGTDTWQLRRVDNGVATVLASGSQEITNNDVIGIRLVNGTVEWYLNGTLIGSASDSTYTGTGKIGLTLENTTWRVDDFGGGQLPKLHNLPILGIG